jgi:nucleotide-binding universal stress UspA family protein
MNIVVGVDGSETSLVALRWAAYEARRRIATLLIVACYEVPVYGSPEGAVYPMQVDEETFKAAAVKVIGRATEVAVDIDPKLTIEGAAIMSPPAAGIAEAAHDDDEIVVGASGHTGFLEGVLGSVATAVVHRSHVPVIVVPANPVVEIGPSMGKIVVGIDGSVQSLEALQWAYGEAELAYAELTAVHAWKAPHSDSDPATILDSSLQSLGPRLAAGTVTVHRKVVERAAKDALLDESNDADLLAVGSHGHGALRSTLLGSVSGSLAQHAKCPVAIIRPRQN